MLGGFHALNKKEDQELSQLTLLANDYEKMKMLPMAFKRSLHSIIQQRLDEMNINQTQLAELINTTGSKISKILSGKQEPDIHFLKAIHQQLGIDGNVLLEVL